MKSLTGVTFARNDGYRGDLNLRAAYSINSLIHTCDEVIYIDWGSENKIDLVTALEDKILRTNKLRVFKVSPEQTKEFTKHDPDPQVCNDVLSKNIGIRRSSSDWIIVVNIDCIVPSREILNNHFTKDVYTTCSKKDVPLKSIQHINPTSVIELQEWAYNNYKSLYNHGYSGACSGDVWSLIDSCGDFQIAPKYMWHASEVRGMEESLTGRGFSDTNLQKKMALAGFEIKAELNLPTLHISHPNTFGGSGRVNDMVHAIIDFKQTTNSDMWGFINTSFEEYII